MYFKVLGRYIIMMYLHSNNNIACVQVYIYALHFTYVYD